MFFVPAKPVGCDRNPTEAVFAASSMFKCVVATSFLGSHFQVSLPGYAGEPGRPHCPLAEPLSSGYPGSLEAALAADLITA